MLVKIKFHKRLLNGVLKIKPSAWIFICSIIRLETRWEIRVGYCFNTSCVLLQAAMGFVSIKN